MRRKKSEQQAGPERADGRVAPADIQQVEFRLAFRGYNERDVDAFLDRLTEDLSWYLEENQRLRAGGSYLPAGADAEAARREAEAILARAREEAAATVRRAEQEAAAIRATGGAPGDARAAVAPFLNMEREFLQSLGSLVQGHAEEVKQMVLALRASAASPVPGSGGRGCHHRRPNPSLPRRRRQSPSSRRRAWIRSPSRRRRRRPRRSGSGSGSPSRRTRPRRTGSSSRARPSPPTAPRAPRRGRGANARSGSCSGATTEAPDQAGRRLTVTGESSIVPSCT